MPVLRLVDPVQFTLAEYFDSFVNSLIVHRGHLPLVKCEIEAYPSNDGSASDSDDDPDDNEHEPNQYLNLWVQYALLCKVRTLKVVGDYLDLQTQLSAPLVSQHLTNLDLQNLVLEKCFEDFPSCPMLEDLTMHACVTQVRRMSFNSLKRLCITECDFPEDYRTCISAPTLTYLRLDDFQGKTPLLECMPLLRTASIALSTDCEDQCGGCDDANCEGCHGYPAGGYQSVLLNGLSNAVYMLLQDQPDVYIYRRDLDCCPTFGRLKTLFLDMWCRAIDLHALVRILQHSPVLEKLTLQIHRDASFLSDSEDEGNHDQVEQSFACAHLKAVNIEFEEDVELEEKVTRITKVLSTAGITPEQIIIKKIPRQDLDCSWEAVPSGIDDSWYSDD